MLSMILYFKPELRQGMCWTNSQELSQDLNQEPRAEYELSTKIIGPNYEKIIEPRFEKLVCQELGILMQ